MTEVFTALAVLVGAMAQSVSGIGFVLVCGPLLVAALGPDDGVRLAVVLSLTVNVAVLARTWRAAELRTALLLLPVPVPVRRASGRTAIVRAAARGVPCNRWL